MGVSEEQLLVERILRGDQAALGRLLERHQGRLYNVVLRMVRNRDDAAEITQQAMVKVIENVKDFNGQAAIGTWMTRIAMNLAISHLRKMKLRRHLSLDAGVGGPAGDGRPVTLGDFLEDDREPGPDQRVERQETMAQLREAIDRLDEDLRAVLVLRDLEQMEYREMAATLNLPMGTVKSRLFRARLALKGLMQQALSSPAAGSGTSEEGENAGDRQAVTAGEQEAEAGRRVEKALSGRGGIPSDRGNDDSHGPVAEASASKRGDHDG